MSAILSIYDTVAARTVTVGGKTPKVYDLHQLPNAAETAQLPCRLLLPDTGQDEGRRFAFFVTGDRSLAHITWRIKDLLLWQPVAQGIGLATVAEALVAYCGAYVEAMRDRNLTAQSVIVGVSTVPNVYEWPVGSQRHYYGVECTLTVEESLYS